MIKKYFILFISFLFTVSVFSQKQPYSIKDGKTIKVFEKGLEYYYNSKNKEAIKEFEKAVQMAPNFIEPNLALGDIYFDQKELEKSLHYYQNALNINKNFSPKAWSICGKISFELEDYSGAKHFFENAVQYALNEKERKETERTLQQINFILYAKAHPVNFNPVNMGENINTRFNEYLPSLTSDGQTLIFTRRFSRTENTTSAAPEEEDIFISEKKNNVWGKAYRMPEPVNSFGNEGAQCISQDGRFLFFTACDRPDGYGSCDIYMCEKIGGRWSNPKNLGKEVNTPAWESNPSLSIDGKTLYFSSNRKDGKGGADIWKTTLLTNGQWSAPVNLGDSVNSPYDEVAPFIHYDDQTLYFSSNGHIGMGGFDIFSTKRKPDNTWTVPVNMGYPVNTKNDESAFIVDAEGKTAIMASDKLGGFGRQDLYSFELYPEARPEAVTYMKGHVFDEISKKPLKSQFEIIDIESGKITASSYSDSITGDFLISLPINRNYVFNAASEGYLFYSDHVELLNSGGSKPFFKEVPMKLIQVGESMILKNVFFDVNQFILRDESKIELDILAQLLRQNKDLKIEIGGHTDNTGDAASNRPLSENRAKAVYEYLLSKNVPSRQLTYKGYGQENPIDSNNTEIGRANNRRTEFKIISK